MKNTLTSLEPSVARGPFLRSRLTGFLARLVSPGLSRPAPVEPRRHAALPLLSAPAPAGFPSPAADYLEAPLDFNELLIDDQAATFVVRVRGDSMEGAGIFDGDYAVINRARSPVTGSVVLAILDEEFVLKRLVRAGDQIILRAENSAYADIVVTEERRFEVWGVVTSTIRTF